ncbi:LCP family protein [Streptomyces iconiensis]|uniref:LCP family protein n=1 Tax=Streptomyces iconiensis TaxID=1384038 RepID=A0ABT7A9U0_9ACTN|nr:LCP family protein [Streptomyces iconiensis]MDJ1137817.1 LCP family protein [Streptomyces iconiensis]
MRWVALSASVLVLAAAATGWSLYKKLDGNIRTDFNTAHELAEYEKERPPPVEGVVEAQNILVLGSDNRGDGNGKYGRDEGSQRSDTAILLHIAGDRRSATGVSIPRDLMVDIPRCTLKDGSRSDKRFAQFNSAFQDGGTACTIRTVEKMTHVRIDHHLVLDFRGFKKLVNAVGGVDVCLPESVRDKDAKLDLPAGRQTLHGEDALGYVRARHSLGNGSDTERIDRQQQFLGSLVKKVRSDGVLLNPGKVYPVLDAATSALTADSGLDSLTELYELARSVRDIPEDHVRFLTVPRQSYELDINRDELVQPEADRLFSALRHDRQVRVRGEQREAVDAESAERDGAQKDEKSGDRKSDGEGEKKKENGEETDTGGDGKREPGQAYRGTTAAHDICSTNEAENEAN